MADTITFRVSTARAIIEKYEARNTAQAITELLTDLRHLCFKDDIAFADVEPESCYAYLRDKDLLPQ